MKASEEPPHGPIVRIVRMQMSRMPMSCQKSKREIMFLSDCTVQLAQNLSDETESLSLRMWLPDGRLKIIDRKKNIFKLAQGTSFGTNFLCEAACAKVFLPLETLFQTTFMTRSCHLHPLAFTCRPRLGEYVAPEKIEGLNA